MAKQVLVTVGTTSFDELIAAVDTDIVQHELQKLGYTHICYQTGRSLYKVKSAILKTSVLQFDHDFDKLINQSELIISHMGAGTVIDVFNAKKKAIFIPNHNVAGNHQMELYNVMDECYKARLDNLISKIKHATETTGPFFHLLLPPTRLKEAIENTLSQ
ncbi:glycosyl transferase [Babesia bovis T2Bo]|uniref:UDP-N-acetylglucosamine transferase subunit ALG13 n=1 Tax=Babesia bovis TaxID=5865 RepID=A7AUA4_BABBO|nr:glycosyl transferase [Babesia bovis T2Bo]EDO06515.1 Glycosyltransferase 28 C-terminal domain family protein [Babesia bovis T2Bo]|eukprot:XP_001610083.1 glycosyl transferase [Babesia bovis T2Bo]